MVFTNIGNNTIKEYPKYNHYLTVGADAKTDQIFLPNIIRNWDDINILEKKMKNEIILQNQPIFTDVLIYYTQKCCQIGTSVVFLNVSQYYQLISEKNKFLPDNSRQKIENLLLNNSNYTNMIWGFDRSYLPYSTRNYQLPLNISYISTISGKEVNELQKGNLLNSVGILPGFSIDAPYNKYIEDFYIMDYRILNFTEKIISTGQIGWMFSLNSDNPAIIQAETNQNFTKITNEVIQYLQNHINMTFSGNGLKFYKSQEFSKSDMNSVIITMSIFNICYFCALSIGLLLAFGLGIIVFQIKKQNQYMNGLLLARGYGKSGIRLLLISQLDCIFIIALILGFLSSILPSVLFIKIFCHTLLPFDLPLNADFTELFGIIGFIGLICFGAFLIMDLIDARKPIREYFHRF
jgi:hypothetical protein